MKPFNAHVDLIVYPMGIGVGQEGRPIAFITKKLNSMQKNYPITEKEFQCIVETLNKFNYL